MGTSHPITAMSKCFLCLPLAAAGAGQSLGLWDCCLGPEQPIRPSLTILILDELLGSAEPQQTSLS